MEPALLALLRAIWALTLSERGLTAPKVPPHDFCAQPCQLAQALPSLQGVLVPREPLAPETGSKLGFREKMSVPLRMPLPLRSVTESAAGRRPQPKSDRSRLWGRRGPAKPVLSSLKAAGKTSELCSPLKYKRKVK